jgi:hypothetical protein
MPTPYTQQTSKSSTNVKTGPQKSASTQRSQNRAAAMAGLGAAKDMTARKAEIEREDRLSGGEANQATAHAVDLVAGTAGEMNLAAKVRRQRRV